jgi:hypothetical protein
MADQGSFQVFIDELVAFEETLSSELRVYRWRPSTVDVSRGGAVYNWLHPSPFEWRDVSNVRARDSLNLVARIAVRYTDDQETMRRLEGYVDLFRDKADGAFRQLRPIGSQAKWVERVAFQPVVDTFNEVDYLAFEFQLMAWLDRNVAPT